MKITADTNILVRAAVRDNKDQAHIAGTILTNAELVSLTIPALCEFAWVLRRVYSFSRDEISTALHALLHANNVVFDRPAVDAGLASLQANGDFADGAVAFEGRRLGGEVFVSLDKKAVKILTDQGQKAKLLT